jgi:hypothetical protein
MAQRHLNVGVVHVFDGAASTDQWRALCGRRKAKTGEGPFEDRINLQPGVMSKPIAVTCSRCRKLLVEPLDG